MRSAGMRMALGLLCCVMLGAMGARVANGQAAKPAPTPEEAKKFIEEAEQRLFDLGLKASRASWVQENFITDDTEQIAADANEVLNTASAKYAKEAHRFDNVKLSPELARKRLLLELATNFPAPDDPKAQKELAQVMASLDGDY
jgi:peptidyl-dipeptidase A